MRAILVAIVALLLAGCSAPRDGSESTAPRPASGTPPLGCAGNHTAGAEDGSAGSGYACNVNASNASI